ncbi:lipopolysaccharide biosynthesis protein [Maribacter polysiphoniae]|uniref:Lipopolysaccharide biosynthesis protein n=1 Tax=Maribacter polysiphoniae TaxID=429344 RepID=A0A316EQX3_9FLAO|nr:lipopolysaccharide biosynthesis protein [Maribacter polysiphoniae]MBD1260012.1 lipopolysaccharide biosynthesis protein [Maribacter polysiphoniae]PWK25470.1 O-antigen/teichoic acid export membrane protein [Maribacter polysiphoniae]
MPEIKKGDESILNVSKDVMVLAMGVIVASLIPILLQPFLKRTFSPEDFGAYDVYLKTFSILVALSCLKYENAILLPKKDSDSKHVIYLCLLISGVIFLVTLLFFFLFSDFVVGLLIDMNMIALFLLPLSVFFYAVFNVFNLYLIRNRKFALSSTSKISRRLGEGVVQVIIGLFKNPHGLVVGDFVGNVVQGFYSFWKADKISPFRLISKTRIKKVLKEYRELPLYTLVPNVLNTFALGALTFLILNNFDLKEVGFLEFTQRILAIPSVFVSVAISQVVFQRVSNLINKKEKVMPLVLSLMSLLIMVSFLFIVVIEFFGESIFVLIGGDGWEKSGEYSKILVYASAVMLVFSPLGKVLIALKKFKTNSIWEITKFISILFLFYPNSYTIKEYIWLYTGIIVFFYLLYGAIIIYQTHKYQIEIKTQT